jgi:PKD repeat protein
MNKLVKWLLIMSICTLFALDSIVLLSFKAGATAVCQEPANKFTSNVTGESTGSDVQFTDQSTNSSTNVCWNSGGNGSVSIQNPPNNKPLQ